MNSQIEEAVADAKVKLNPHTVAQVLGYYSACALSSISPPLVAVLSHEYIQFVLH